MPGRRGFSDGDNSTAQRQRTLLHHRSRRGHQRPDGFGKSRRSCITHVGDVAQKQITTIEGLAQGDRLHPVQQAFLDEGAMQCAYCTSGMIMTAVSLLNAKRVSSSAEIARSMEGNICRCGTQPRIVLAIQRAARMMDESKS